MEFKAKEIAEILGGTVEGNPEATVTTFARIESGKPGSICFFANPKYEQYVYTCKSDIIIWLCLVLWYGAVRGFKHSVLGYNIVICYAVYQNNKKYIPDYIHLWSGSFWCMFNGFPKGQKNHSWYMISELLGHLLGGLILYGVSDEKNISNCSCL